MEATIQLACIKEWVIIISPIFSGIIFPVFSGIIMVMVKNNVTKSLEFYKIKFTKLHENRALIIRDLYSLAYDLENKFGSLIQAGAIIEQEKIDEVNNLRYKFNELMKINDIYFSEDDYSKLAEFDRLCNESIVKAQRISNAPQNVKWTTENENEWKGLNDKLNNSSKSILITLRDSFRKILGVDLE